FLVAIIIEVFKLFGSLKGSGNSSGATDWSKFKIGKLFSKSNNKINSLENDEKKKMNEGKQIAQDEHKLNESIAGDDLQTRTDIDDQIKQVNEAGAKLSNPEVPVEEIKKNIAKLLELSSKENKEVRKHYLILQRMRSENNTFISLIDKILEDEQKIYDELKKERDEIEKKLSNPKDTDDKGLLEQTRDDIKHKMEPRKTIIDLANTVKESLNAIKNNERKMNVVDRKFRVNISKINSKINKLNSVVEKMPDLNKDDNRQEIFNELSILRKELEEFKNEWNQIMRDNTELIEFYKEHIEQPYTRLCEEKGKLNKI
ncbi:MAG: hypothetical protein ACOCP8_10000, partial [archaeon]